MFQCEAEACQLGCSTCSLWFKTNGVPSQFIVSIWKRIASRAQAKCLCRWGSIPLALLFVVWGRNLDVRFFKCFQMSQRSKIRWEQCGWKLPALSEHKNMGTWEQHHRWCRKFARRIEVFFALLLSLRLYAELQLQIWTNFYQENEFGSVNLILCICSIMVTEET